MLATNNGRTLAKEFRTTGLQTGGMNADFAKLELQLNALMSELNSAIVNDQNQPISDRNLVMTRKFGQWILTAILICTSKLALAVDIQSDTLYPKVKLVTSMGDIELELDRTHNPHHRYLTYVVKENMTTLYFIA